MLDICSCIISFIVISDLVPDLYFQDTDTWDSCEMHCLDYSCDLEFLGSCDYVSRQLLVQDISCHYIHITPCMHGLIVHDLSSDYSCYYYYIQFLLFPNIFPTYYYYIFIFSPSCSCTIAGPLLTDLYIIFQCLDLNAGIESFS